MAASHRDALAALAKEARRGSRRAFAALVHAEYGVALAFAHDMLRDYHEAEDATQEAFAEAARSIESLKDERAVSAWLRSIVRHRCARRLRQRDLLRSPTTETSEDPADGPDTTAERLSEVRALLRTLPRAERDVITLFYLKECSQREIAAFLGIPPTTVNNRLYQARERLKRWGENMPDITDHEPEHAASIGTVVSVDGPVIEAQFDPDAPLDIFDALVVMGEGGKTVERMKICHRAPRGRVVCLSTGPEAAVEKGASVMNTRQLGVGLTPLTPLQTVTSERLRASVEILGLPSGSDAPLVETGIKAIDLLCPLPRAGNVVQVATARVGRMVLLDELLGRLRETDGALRLFALVTSTEPETYRGWDTAGVLQERVGNTRTFWVLAKGATDPDYAGLEAFDAVIAHSPVLAVQGLYPSIDPARSRSVLLRSGVANDEHVETATRAREALSRAKLAFCDPAALELLASHAFAAARQRYRDFTPDLSGDQAVELGRGRKLQLFLSQPFDAATEITGWDGCHVALKDTLEGCRAILDGHVDDLPASAFAFAGTLGDVRDRAASGESRRHP